MQQAVSGARTGLVFILGIVLFLVGTQMMAQTITGGITGTVTDSSGSVIKGAVVTATDVSTNISSTAVTNEDGIYALRFLKIGSYKLVVTSPGFASYGVGP